MWFTWIHLNQVNVGTNVAIDHMPYWRWCTLTRISTCTTVYTCTSTISSLLKKRRIQMPRTKSCGRRCISTTHWRSTQACQDSSLSVTQTCSSRKHGNSSSAISTSKGTKQPCKWTTSHAQQLVLEASSPLTQANLPQIIKAFFNLSEHATTVFTYYNARGCQHTG